MLTITPDTLIHEIIRAPWEQDSSESILNEDSNWDILDENNEQDVVKRHWFKQNYINQNPRNGAVITYH